jgi:transposase
VDYSATIIARPRDATQYFNHTGKPRLLGMSKRGDRYLRKLLVHGARATLRWVDTKCDDRSQWLRALIARRGKNRAAVALANKNARIVWALLAHNQEYRVRTVI